MKLRSMENRDKDVVTNWKWTANARVCKMGEGWQRDGLNCFNDLCTFVAEDRDTESGANTFGFENWYLQKCQEEANVKKRKRNRVITVVPVVAFNMLIDLCSDNEDDQPTKSVGV